MSGVAVDGVLVEEREPPGDPVLLAPEEGEGDGAGVVGLYELLALVSVKHDPHRAQYRVPLKQ